MEWREGMDEWGQKDPGGPGVRLCMDLHASVKTFLFTR